MFRGEELHWSDRDMEPEPDQPMHCNVNHEVLYNSSMAHLAVLVYTLELSRWSHIPHQCHWTCLLCLRTRKPCDWGLMSPPAPAYDSDICSRISNAPRRNVRKAGISQKYR